jgi:hypothetical protein
MTAAAEAAARHRPPRGAGTITLTAARLLRIELRHSAMPWILPVVAALFWFDSYRFGSGEPPFWVQRTVWNMGQGRTFTDFAPFVAGAAAWMGSRDDRRRTADLVAGAVRPRWAAQAAAWAAAAIWAVGAYLAFVGVMFAVYAHQGLQGSPPWWWVAVGAAAVTAFSAAGFAVGAFFPSRFAAPAAAFGAFLAVIVSAHSGFGDTSGWPLILPNNANGNYQALSGIFYPYLPDLPIARVMFLAGIAGAALGVLGLPARAGGPWLRRAAAVVTLAGVAAAGTASVLVRTARLTPHGVVIPVLHDAANDRPIGYTPACARAAGVPVCLDPAYRRYLPEVAADLRPVLAEVAGLPGAPARVAQVAGRYASGMFEFEGRRGGDDQRQPARAARAARHVQHAAERDSRVRGAVRSGTAAAVSARVRGRGQRRRHRGTAGGAGCPAAARRPAVRRAAPGADYPRAAAVGAGRPSAASPGIGAVLRARDAAGRAGLCRGAAARRAACRRPARLAGRPPGRGAVRPAHAGSAAMTAAGVRSPPPGAASAPLAAWPAAATLRLAWLYLLSRRGPAALGLLAGLGALLWAALHWRWNVAGGPAAQDLIPLTIETGAAAVIAVTTHGPFGDPERATGRWLPWLRLAAAMALTATASGALAAGAAGGVLPGGIPAMFRNLAGMTGTGLLSAAALGGAFGWTGPMAYWLATESVLAAHWTTPWIWPARPPHDRGAAICAALVLAAGIAAVALLGARDSGRRSAPD